MTLADMFAPDIIIDVMCNPGVIALMLTIIVSNVFGFWYAVLFFIGLIILFAIFYAIAMKLEEYL